MTDWLGWLGWTGWAGLYPYWTDHTLDKKRVRERDGDWDQEGRLGWAGLGPAYLTTLRCAAPHRTVPSWGGGWQADW